MAISFFRSRTCGVRSCGRHVRKNSFNMVRAAKLADLSPQTSFFRASSRRPSRARLTARIMPLLLLSSLSYGLSLHPAAVPTPRAPAASTPSCRRDVLAGAGAAAAFALLGLPSGAQASYALYQASQDSYLDRKTEGFVPVATNDKATLRGIQSDIADKRPQYRAVKAKKKPAQCRAMSKASRLSLRPASAPEASLNARPRPRLPQAPASLGQPAAWVGAGGPHPAFVSTQVLRGSDRERAADAREHLRGVRPLEGRPVQHRHGRVRWPPQVHSRRRAALAAPQLAALGPWEAPSRLLAAPRCTRGTSRGVARCGRAARPRMLTAQLPAHQTM